MNGDRLRIGFIPLCDATALIVAVDKGFAAHLRGVLLNAEEKLLDGDIASSCRDLDKVRRDLARQAGKQIDASVASQLDMQVKNVWTNMGCAVCT